MRIFGISNHAVEQYKIRALACPERHRLAHQLRPVMQRQIKTEKMKSMGRGTRAVKFKDANGVTLHTFVVEDEMVVTVLGFMMRPYRRALAQSTGDRQ